MKTMLRLVKSVLVGTLLCTAALLYPSSVMNGTSTAHAAENTPLVSEPVVPQVLDIDLRTLPKPDLQRSAKSAQVVPIGKLPSPDFRARTSNVQENPQELLGSLQSSVGASTTPLAFTAPNPNFDGIGFTGSVPPDTNGDVGRNHYIQAVNARVQIFDKHGNSLAGPFAINTLWSAANFPGACSAQNNGDPLAVYDHLADRWLISQFALPNGFDVPPTHQCIAISRTADPVSGGWYLYDFTFNFAHDYPKVSVWPDAYYMSSQQGFPGGGLNLVAFDRANMLNGNPATFQTRSVGGPALVLLPSDLDGLSPAPGTPNFFARQVDGALWGGNDRVEIYEFHVDWGNPANTHLTGPITLPTAPFDSGLCNPGDLDENCIPQPGTTGQLSASTAWPMWRLQYRNFGSYETLVFNHTVDADGNAHAGIRWYELRKTASSEWSIFQQGTFAPQDFNRRPGWEHRWLGSIAMDKVGNIALGYSVASTNTVGAADINGFPSIRYAGRMTSDPLGLLPHGEFTLVNGTGSQALFDSSGNAIWRWGDYSSMTVDPVDDCTFWYTQEYNLANGAWQTRIGAFLFPSCNPADLAVSMTQSPSPVNAGDKLTYNITVVNNGPNTAPNVVLTDTLPFAVTYEATTSFCFEQAPQILTCNLGDLPAGATRAFTVQVTVDADLVARAGGPTTLTNIINATSDLADTNPANNQATSTTIVNESADVRVRQECEPNAPVPAGTEAICTMIIENVGPSTGRNVSSTVTFLSDGQFNFGVLSSSVCNAPTNPQTGSSVVTCQVGNLAAGTSVLVKIPVSANEPQNINTHLTVTSATPDPSASNNQASDALTVSALSNLAISLTGAPEPVVAGAKLIYGLNVVNLGPSTAQGLILSDVLPDLMRFSQASVANNAGVCAQQPAQPTMITCQVDHLRPGETVTATIEVLVDLTKLTQLVAQNAAEVTAATPDPNSVNNKAALQTPVKPPVVYLSTESNGTVNDVKFADEDVIGYDPNSATWQKVFDGSDVNIKGDIDGLAILNDGSLLLSFNKALKLPGLGLVDDSDIVKFIPTSLGENTAGTFEWFFDGSDVELTDDGEDIDAISFTTDGRLLISVADKLNVSGVTGKGNDLFVFNATSFGEQTAGFWEIYFDGADVGLQQNIWGVWVEQTGEIHLVAKGDFSVGNISGDGNDIFVCTPASLGTTTSCTFSPFWNGADYGLRNGQIDAIAIASPLPIAPTTNLSSANNGEEDPEDDNVEENTSETTIHQLFLPLVER